MKQNKIKAILSKLPVSLLAVGLIGCAAVAPQSSQVEPTAPVEVVEVVPATATPPATPTQPISAENAVSFPVIIENCDLSYTYEASPQRAAHEPGCNRNHAGFGPGR